jgi:hypothetical protein
LRRKTRQSASNNEGRREPLLSGHYDRQWTLEATRRMIHSQIKQSGRFLGRPVKMAHSVTRCTIKTLIAVLVVHILDAVFNRISIVCCAPRDDYRYIVRVRGAVHNALSVVLGFPMK